MILTLTKQIIPLPIKRFVRKSWLVPGKIITYYQIKTATLHPCPVIILGHEKSGKTPLATLLGKASGQAIKADSIYRIDQGHSFQKMVEGKMTLREFVVSHKYYFSTSIIEDPKFSYFFDEVTQIFPLAKYIYVVRDPRSVIRNSLTWRKIPGNLDKPLIQDLVEVRHEPMPGKNYIEQMAHRWNLAVRAFLKNKEKMVLVKYEDFADDNKEIIRQVAQSVGLILKYDISQSPDLQSQTQMECELSWLRFFGMKNLRRIDEICGEKMKKFGYRQSF